MLTYGEEYLISFIEHLTSLFCNNYYSKEFGCENCPLKYYEKGDCRIAYISYLLLSKEKEGGIN